MSGSGPSAPTGMTAWSRRVAGPIRSFLVSDKGGAGVLLMAVAAALVWANVGGSSYERVWGAHLTLGVGHAEASRDLRTWVNSGLMTLFFLVVGLEARREFDLGDLRDRRRVLLPLVGGLLGMAVPALIFVGFNAGTSSGSAWGVAMSTDTALALGLLSLVGGRRVPDRVQVFLVTLFVVDDIASLLVVAFVYSRDVRWLPLVLAATLFVVTIGLNRVGVRRGAVFALFGIVAWFFLLTSGVDPIILGLAFGLAATAYTPNREQLEQASRLYRLFREQPTAELARSLTSGVVVTVSPNDRVRSLYAPWATYVIVPLFALANAGLVLTGGFLGRAFTSPIVWGVVVGYVVGKPFAVTVASWLVTRGSRGRVRPDVGWLAVFGSGTIAGVGFTVSFVIAARVLTGDALAEAKFGVLFAALLATLVTYAVFRIGAALPIPIKARLLIGDLDGLPDLTPPVDPDRDHTRGSRAASVTVVEYGDFECPYCGQAEPAVRELLTETDLLYVWRHLPLPDVHPHALLAAEAAEAAGVQGKFWEMHDLLMAHQDHLRIADLLDYARDLGLDTDRFHDDVVERVGNRRIQADVESADRSGVSGTPTFFINGQRHYGAYDIDGLTRAVKAARVRAAVREHAGSRSS